MAVATPGPYGLLLSFVFTCPNAQSRQSTLPSNSKLKPRAKKLANVFVQLYVNTKGDGYAPKPLDVTTRAERWFLARSYPMIALAK